MEWRAPAGLACLAFWIGVVALAGCDAFDAGLLSTTGSSKPDASSAAQRDASADQIATMPDARVPTLPSDAGDTPSASDSGPSDARVGELDASDDESDTGTDDPGARDAGPTEPVCVPSTVDFCEHLPALSAAARIDGELDCGPVLRKLDPVGWNGTDAMPSGHETSIAVAWREDGLYLFAKVVAASVAPHTWDGLNCGDAIEFYVDADGESGASGAYADPGSMQFIVAAPSATAPDTLETTRYVGGNARGWPSPKVKTARLDDGYAVEVFIAAADMDLSKWSPKTKLGLDVVVDVSGSADFRCGNQIGQYFMKLNPSGDCAGARGEPWCDTRAFCTPVLDAAH